jgi:hypothetical protein
MPDPTSSYGKKARFIEEAHRQGHDIVINRERFYLSSGTYFRPTFYSKVKNTYYQLCFTRQLWHQVRHKVALFKIEYPKTHIEVINKSKIGWCHRYGNTDLELYLKQRDMSIARFAKLNNLPSIHVIKNYIKGVPETYHSARIYSKIRDIVNGRHMPTYLDKATDIRRMFRNAMVNNATNIRRTSMATGIAYPALYYMFIGKRFLSHKNVVKLENYLKKIESDAKHNVCVVRKNKCKMYKTLMNSQLPTTI